jgi:membrane protein implicated in regulation of membrane protease activity
VGQAVLLHRISERARDVLLSDEIIEGLRPVFSRKNLVTHALNLVRGCGRENRFRKARQDLEDGKPGLAVSGSVTVLDLKKSCLATFFPSAFFLLVVGKGLRAQRLPVRAGAETMVGRTVTALTPIDSRSARIFIEGENWNAVSDTPMEKDEVAEVAAVQGLTLKLRSRGK